MHWLWRWWHSLSIIGMYTKDKLFPFPIVHYAMILSLCQRGREKTSFEILDFPQGGHLYFRLDIILVKGLSKHTLNMYSSGTKIDPKYAFLHAFFLICPSCPFQNLSTWPKTHPFFPILHIFAPLNDVRMYIVWSLKTTLITWIFFFTRMISNFKYKCPPPHRDFQYYSLWESWQTEQENHKNIQFLVKM